MMSFCFISARYCDGFTALTAASEIRKASPHRLPFRHTLGVLRHDLFDVLGFAVLEELSHATDEEL